MFTTVLLAIICALLKLVSAILKSYTVAKHIAVVYRSKQRVLLCKFSVSFIVRKLFLKNTTGVY